MRGYCQLQRALASCGITVEQQPAALVQSSSVQQNYCVTPMNVKNLPAQSSKLGAGVSCFPSSVIISGKWS